MTTPWARFTDEQRRAAFLVDRSVVSTAAAGSGKTQVMAVRYCACLLRDAEPLHPERILAITFTREAAANLRARIESVLRAVLSQPIPSFPDYQRHGGADAELTAAEITHLTQALAQLPAAPIGTVDAFCLGLVGEHAELLGRDPGLTPPSSDGPEGRQCQEAAWLRLRAEANAQGGGDLAELVGAYGEFTVRGLVSGLASQGAALPDEQVVADDHAVEAAVLSLRRPQMERLAAALQEAQALCRQAGAKGKLVAAVREVAAMPPLADPPAPGQAEAFRAWLGGFTELSLVGNRNPDLARCVRELQDALDYPARRNAKGDRPGEDSRLRCASLGAVARWDAIGERQLASRAEVLARSITRYQELLTEITAARALADFSTTARQALRLLDQPAVAGAQAARFRHVLLDEAQDLNRLQGRLMERLWSVIESPRMFSVGDHRQSIYGFRHAEPALFRGWEEGVEGRGGAVAPLGLNFRSHPALVAAVRDIFSIEHLRAAFRPELISAGRSAEDFTRGGVVRAWRVLVEDPAQKDGTAAAEAQQVAQLIAGSLAAGRPPEAHAVLLRTRARMRLYADALERAGIAVDTDFPEGLYHAQECWDVEAVLRLCLDPHDRFALACAVAGPWGVADPQDRRLLVEALSLPTSQEASSRILDATALRALLAEVGPVLAAEGPGAAVRFLARQPALARRYGALPLARRRLANLQQLAEEQAAGGQALDASAFLERLHERRRLGADGAEADGEALGSSGVRLLTIHAAKGLEWPVVILPELASPYHDHDRRQAALGRAREHGLALSCAPGRGETMIGMRRLLALEALGRERLEEHSRAFYVACTRAVEELHLIRSGAHSLGLEIRCPADWLDLSQMSWTPVSIATEPLPRVPPAPRHAASLPPLAALPAADPGAQRVQVRSISELLAVDEPPPMAAGALGPLAGWRRGLGIRVHEALRRHGLGMPVAAARQACAPYAPLLDAALIDALIRHLSVPTWVPGWEGMQRQVREQPFCSALITGDASRLVSGTVDLLARDGQGAWHLYDFKTGASAGSGHDQRQLQAYAQLCAAHLDGPLASVQVLDVAEGRVQPVATDAGVWALLAQRWQALDAPRLGVPAALPA